MRIVVTGGAGFIGSHLVDALLKKHHEVYVLDNLSSGKKQRIPSQVELCAEDINSPKATEWLLRIQPECIFHLAAQMDVRRSVADPAFDAQTNVVGTVRLLAAAVKAGCKTVIFASTGGAIYGEQNEFPATENHACAPESPYGVSKLCCEHYLHFFAKAYGLRTVCLRFANVYGPRQDPHGEAGVVAIFAEKLLKQTAPTIFGNGEQTRDFVYVEDVVRANILALENLEVQGAFNVGTGIETSVNELAQHMAQLADFQKPCVYAEARLGEQQRSCISPALLTKTLGWKPQITLQEGLKQTLQFFKG